MSKSNVARSIVVPIFSFALILLVMNGYQYLKLKQKFTENILERIATNELKELQSVFHDVEENLLLLRDWGKNNVLAEGSGEDLTRKLIPLLVRLKYISGVILANNHGEEFFIFRSENNYTTRETIPKEQNTLQRFVEWSSDFVSLKTWEKVTEYDPRTRPWFTENARKEDIHWTGVYNFYYDNQKGITASVSWKNQDINSGYYILGIDVTIDMFREILDRRIAEHPGVLFLTRPDGSVIVGDQKADKEASDKDTLLNTLNKLVDKWQNEDRPANEMTELSLHKSKWIASFQKISHKDSAYWIGLATTEEELADWFDYSLFTIDMIEIVIAFSGAAFVLFLMWHSGLLSGRILNTESPEQRFVSFIKEGEGASVEFKSTVRTNLKTGKTGKEIELAWLKAVVAFLNTNGGTVLLGVDDKGKLLGLDQDSFENTDKLLLHVKNLLNHHIGPDFSSFFNTTTVNIDNKLAVMIECTPAKDAVFLKIGKNEEFYIRSGPSSTKLSPSQIVSYIKK